MSFLKESIRSATFSRQQRLLSASQFKTLFDAAEMRQSNRVFLILARTNHLPQARLGLVVGKKKARRAVDRNLVKRLAREYFRQHQQQLAGLDILVLLRSLPVGKDRREIAARLEQLFASLLAKPRQD